MMKGFTLFELLISISIIGIISAIGVTSYNGVMISSRNSKRIEDLTTIQKAAEAYYMSHHAYPTTLDQFTSGPDKVLERWPMDPKQGWSGYGYLQGPAFRNYCLCATLEGTGQGNTKTDCTLLHDPNWKVANMSDPARNNYCVEGLQ